MAAVFGLVAFGLLMIYSASAVVASQKYGDSLYFFRRQFLWSVVGWVGLWTASRIDPEVWRKVSLPLLGISFILLVLTLVPGIGVEINGARRWIRMGSFSFQPSELAKLAVITYLATYLIRKEDRVKVFWHGLFPPLVVVGVLVVLILVEPDLGTAAVIAGATVGMLFLGGARILHLAMLGLVLIPILTGLVLAAGYRKQRILAFLDPWGDPMGSGFQVIQSFLSFGHGGFLGVGLGEGRQKLFFLPEAHTDFIYAVIGEELGLLGGGLVVFLFLFFLWRCLRILQRHAGSFEGNLAMGIGVLIGIQAVTNLGVVTGLLPTKGIPLPFMSFGGTSLLINLVMVGILLGISRRPGSFFQEERQRLS